MTLRRLLARLLRSGAVPPPDPAAFDSVPGANEHALDDWARELGVTREVMTRMVEQRRALVYDVAAQPRAWGFDLASPRAPRRDVATEFRAQTRLQGTLAESFLADHGALLALVPDPPTLPDGTPLDRQLIDGARLDPEFARDVARHLRSTIQARLGRPLDAQAIEHAVREASWDHEQDTARVLPDVLRALADIA